MNYSMINLKKIKTIIFIALGVAFASQFSLDLFVSDFKVSFGIIAMSVFLYMYKAEPILVGITTGFFVYIFRIFRHSHFYVLSQESLKGYFPEFLFYVFFGIIISTIITKNTNNIIKIVMGVFFADLLGNITEMLMRVSISFFTNYPDAFGILFFVAFIRSSIVLLVLTGLKKHEILIVKQEHDFRYKKLLWLTSKLKSEMYLMEKNMDDIEKVMSNSYKLFEELTKREKHNDLANLAVEIARDVHEVKKEYGLVFRGMSDILEEKLVDSGMEFFEIISILKESMQKEIKFRNISAEIHFDLSYNFFTNNHYYLMSIFRNLIMNSMDAFFSKDRFFLIQFNQRKENDFIYFNIKDNGVGIKESDIKYIFNSGFSTKINYETGEVNRGLGLSLVKEIIEKKLDGTINVESTYEIGTEFIIKIPTKNLEELNENIYH